MSKGKFQRKLVFIIPIIVLVLVIGFVFSSSFSFAEVLENGTRVEENSDLTYYIDVMYDGKDSQAISSSDSATADVFSDYIYVEDKLPEGLTFKEFVSSGGNNIGAVKRSDSSTSCSGYVVDGYDGLVYDSNTNTISFKVKNLQAGCKLTVGVVTTTPSLGNVERMDFYNTATAKENSFSAQSNTVHVFMGNLNSSIYQVKYQFEGDVPNNVEVPTTNTYVAGTTVGVAQSPRLDGYTFSGWTSNDVTVSNGTFTMPSDNVVFTGSFTKDKTYEVSYRVDGDMPSSYKVPSTKEYSIDSDVSVDSLKKGDIIDGYRFLGWETDDAELVVDGESIYFTMPDRKVELVGKFEKETYTVTYQFQGSVIPDNAESLLPGVKSYAPGEEVELASNPTASGYRFLGWYSDTTFKMPSKDVVIYGEWAEQAGVFAPTITQEILNPKDRYTKGDVVQFRITVTNTASFSIKDVILENKYPFMSGDGYTLMNDYYVKISSIPASGSVVVYGQYIVEDDTYQKLENVVEIVGAIADNNYILDTTKNYQAKVEFKTGNFIIKINKIDKNNNSLTGAEFAIYTDKDLTNQLATGLVFENLNNNQTYYLKELKAPDGYVLSNHVSEISISKEGDVVVDGEEVSVHDGSYQIDIVNEKQNFINSPNTIDSIITYIILFIVSCGVIIFVVYILKNNHRNGPRKNRCSKKKKEEKLEVI